MNTRGAILITSLLGLVLVATVAASPRPSTLPPAKQAMADKIAAARAHTKAGAPNKQNDPGRPPEVPEPAPVLQGVAAGVGRLVSEAETVRPPGYPDDLFTNSWSVTSSGLNVDVWAGARGENARRGFLVVVVWNADRTKVVGGGVFEPALAHGWLRISAATGSALSLRSADGDSLVFDAGRLAFN